MWHVLSFGSILESRLGEVGVLDDDNILFVDRQMITITPSHTGLMMAFNGAYDGLNHFIKFNVWWLQYIVEICW